MWMVPRRRSDKIKTLAMVRLYKHKMPKIPANKDTLKFFNVIPKRFCEGSVKVLRV
jgi:hypothetical protein